MNLLAIVGSPRKNKATDKLVDKAIEGVMSVNPDCNVKKINLADYDIKFCKNCLSCMKNVKAEPYAKCIIDDDMSQIYDELVKADHLIFGTPIHMGSTPGILSTFLERICWTFSRPEKRHLTIKGCPAPRTSVKRKAIIIAVTGLIPPIYKILCNQATPLIKETIRDTINAKTVGKMYAGNIWSRGVDYYFKKAHKLGRKLAKK